MHSSNIPEESTTKSRDFSEKKARLKSFLKEKGFKSTRQRDIIASEFLKTRGHITAEDLYKKVSKKHSEIGFTTVYRTLKLLTKSGLATEQAFADNLTRYEPVSSEDHHDHLICMKCGSIKEFENSNIERLQEKIAGEFGFSIVTHRMELYGYCSTCSDDGQEES
jgi:Fur family ferric uptake transcriptional regulator